MASSSADTFKDDTPFGLQGLMKRTVTGIGQMGQIDADKEYDWQWVRRGRIATVLVCRARDLPLLVAACR